MHAVEDGEAALRYLKSGAEVDVLFTDINLAGRMDGSMLAREARAAPRIADRLLFRALFALCAGAAGVAFDLREEAL